MLLPVVLAGCSSDASPDDSEFREDFDIEVSLRPSDGEVNLPTLEPPLSAEETRALRDAFSWEETDEIPETDSSGRPALYYALVYLQSLDDVELLDLTGVHHSGIPLFEEERERWRGQTGFFMFEGDGEGVFRFAIIPGFFFNAMREAALDGEQVFRAVVLRTAPDQFSLADGSLSYEALRADGFVYGGGLDEPIEGEEPQGSVGAQTQPFITEIIRGIGNAVEEVVKTTRDAFGELDEAAAGSAIVLVSVRPLNTDDGFADGSWMRRAWGDDIRDNDVPSFGAPMWIRGAVIEAHKGASLSRARLQDWGIARLQVPKGRQTVCLELGNQASDITALLTELTLCTFEGDEDEEFNFDFQTDRTLVMDVEDARVNMFAQFQDGHDYMRWVAGREPRQARVSVGTGADFIGEINGQRAVAFCMGDPRSPLGLIIPLIVPEILVVRSADIVMPALGGRSANSRGVPTHEYGHHVLCDLMIDNNIAKFAEAWTNVIINIFGDQNPDAGSDMLYSNEAWADFFTLQVVGGTNYPTLPNAQSTGGIGYCPVAPPSCSASNPDCARICGGTPSCGQDCAEDNVGGGAQADEDYTGAGDTPYQQQIAKVVTLFHDAFDGPTRAGEGGLLPPSPGAAFNREASGSFGEPIRASTEAVQPSGARGDDPIELPGTAIRRFVSILFDQWATISETNFYNALALTVLEHGYSTNETCELFSLHVESGDCTDVLHPSILSGEDLIPGPVLNFTVSTDTETGHVTFSWQRNSAFATGYELVLTPESGPARTIPFDDAEEVTHVEENLPGDTAYTASVATINGANRSEPVVQELVTLADPVDGVSVAADRGRIDVSWIPPASGRFRAYELWQLEPEERLLTVTTDTSVSVPGLSDAFEYQFGVRTLNRNDEAGRLALSARVRPLPSLVVYVAVSGNDVAPDAGSISTPFAHLGPALQRAFSIDADTIRMLEGVYEESGPLLIGSSIRIEGGYRLNAGAWEPGGSATRIEVTGTQTGLLAPQTQWFNVRGQGADAAVAVAGGLDVSVIDVEIAAVGADDILPRTRCTAVLQVAGSSLVLERATVRMERPSSTLACVGGVFAVSGIGRDPRVSVSDSTVTGYGPPNLSAVPDGMELGGLVVQSADTLVVERSVVAGLSAPSLSFLPGDLSAVGLATRSVDVIQLRRSDFLAVDEPRNLRVLGAGRLTGAELQANVSIAADDSVFRTPTGGTNNNALDVKSTSGSLGTVNLVHVTAVAGEDWDLSRPTEEPFAGAALRLAGSIDVLHVVNSVLSFAAGASDAPSVRYAGVDISDRDTLPGEFAFQGNIVSTPSYQWRPNAEGALVYCLPGTNEFANAYTQTDLQGGIGYTCGGEVPNTSLWNTGSNLALTEAPDPGRSDLGPGLPWCAAFGIDGNEDGYPSAALPELPAPPLGASGVSLGSLPYVVQAPRDRGGAMRDPSRREAAGAWLP